MTKQTTFGFTDIIEIKQNKTWNLQYKRKQVIVGEL